MTEAASAHASADGLVAELRTHASEGEREKILKRMTDPKTEVVGVRMGTLFAIARANAGLPLAEVGRLLDSPLYEARMAAVSILDFRTRRRGVTEAQRRELHDLYLARHDRIDTWDLVDRAAPRVIGWYLLDKPHTELFELARSPDRWRRRTAITAAFWLIRAGDLDDPLALCELLVGDPEHFVQTSLGTALREIGRVDEARLRAFLAAHEGELTSATRRIATSRLRGA